jgi:hypothetical protein
MVDIWKNYVGFEALTPPPSSEQKKKPSMTLA